MAETRAEIIATPEEVLPYKVVFSIDGKNIAERAVTSLVAGRELIEAILPTLQGYQTGGS
jgi:hypothetical protein